MQTSLRDSASFLSKAKDIAQQTSLLAEENGISRSLQKTYAALTGVAAATLLSATLLPSASIPEDPFASSRFQYDISNNDILSDSAREQFFSEGKAKIYDHPFESGNKVAIVSTNEINSLVSLAGISINRGNIQFISEHENTGYIGHQSHCVDDYKFSTVIKDHACVTIIDNIESEELFDKYFYESGLVQLNDLKNFNLDHELIHAHSTLKHSGHVVDEQLGIKENVIYEEAVADVAALINRYKSGGLEHGNAFTNALIAMRENDSLHKNNVPLLKATQSLLNEYSDKFLFMENEKITGQAIDIVSTFNALNAMSDIIPNYQTQDILPTSPAAIAQGLLDGSFNRKVTSELFEILNLKPYEVELFSNEDMTNLITSHQNEINALVEQNHRALTSEEIFEHVNYSDIDAVSFYKLLPQDNEAQPSKASFEQWIKQKTNEPSMEP